MDPAFSRDNTKAIIKNIKSLRNMDKNNSLNFQYLPPAPPKMAKPADFHSPKQLVCTGAPVTFSDESWNAVVESRLWEFEGGTPATATSANVNVSFDTPGWKKIRLTATNAANNQST